MRYAEIIIAISLFYICYFMQNTAQWLDWYKSHQNLYSDYQLAKHWQVQTAYISQLRKGKRRLPLAFILQIANALQIDALEIITALEYPRACEQHQKIIKRAYFDALLPNVHKRYFENHFVRKRQK